MLLKRGDNNENVKQLQIKLGLEPIGNFGPKTEEAVKAFQLKNGLTADGIVGDGTWAKIMGGSAPAPQPAAPIVPVGGLKLDKLKGHIPDAVIQMIPDTAAKFQINTPLRLAHFLAQCGHESGGFRVTSENLTIPLYCFFILSISETASVKLFLISSFTVKSIITSQ